MSDEYQKKKYTHTGLKRLWNAFFYSANGLKAAFNNEAAFRQELLLALVLIPTAFILPVDKISRVIMISSMLFVLIIELVNSSLEALVDLVTDKYHPLAKRVKDMGSAMVFFKPY